MKRRLVSADSPGTANDEAFGYDRIGNRLTATRGGTTIGAPGSTTKYSIYTPATQTGNPGYAASTNHRLSQIRIGSISGAIDSGFGFDNEGRLTSQTGSTPRTLTWDANGRLRTLTQSGTTETYAYDPSNHRIGRSGGTVGNLDYFLEGEHLESVYQSGTLLEKYFRGSTVDELVAGYTTQGGKLTPYFFQHDQVMSVAAETKPNGGTQATLSYFAFGENQATTGAPISRIQYAGRENDGNGLIFYRARYYDPKCGCFISEDPKKFTAGPNFYAYVGNNPINANDPRGMDAVSAIIKYGGRLGSQETREHVIQVAQEWIAKGWKLISGGGEKETLIKNPVTNSSKGGAYADIELYNPTTQQTMRINTVDTYAYGITPTAREAAAGSRIQSYLPNDEFTMIPKPRAGAVAAGAAAGLGAGSAQASDGGILGSGATWNDVGNFLLDMLIPGGVGEVGRGSDIVPRGPSTIDLPQSSLGAGAAGGFLLYPNKPNTNMIQSVYSK